MRTPLAAGLLACLLALGACTGTTQETDSTADTATTSSSAAADPSAAPGSATDPTTAAGTGQVSANDASVAELTEAFEAAGIDNAGKWAHEVEEYRPYPTDDPGMTKLREELAKYNPGPGVVDQIVATLAL